MLDCASAISSSESEFTTTGKGGGSGACGGCDAYTGCDAADGTPTGADTDSGGAGVVARLIVSLTVSLAATDSVAGSPRLILTVSLSAVAVRLTVSQSVIAVSVFIDSTVSGVSADASARSTLIVSLSVNA